MSKKVKILLASLVVLIIAMMVFVNLKKSRGSVIEVTSTKSQRGTIIKTVSGSGDIQPEVKVQISARISAEIIKIHVKEGALVQRGQLLAELDRERYSAQTEEAESRVMAAQATLKKAESDYSRAKDLFDKNLNSQADLDVAEASKMSAQSSLQQAQAFLKQATDDLAKTRLSSPISGTVTKLFKEEGEIVLGSQFQADPIMTVSDLSKMEAWIEVDENDVVLIKVGDSAKIEVDAIPDTVFQGTVKEIAHSATTRSKGTQEQVTNFEVKVAVIDQVEKLRPGMTATVDISTEKRENVVYIPIQCVTLREVKDDTSSNAEPKRDAEIRTASTSTGSNNKDNKAKQVVFLISEGIVKMVPVETGISDDNNIEIKVGLDEGQEVVSGSYQALSKTLKDGSRVKIKTGMAFRQEK